MLLLSPVGCAYDRISASQLVAAGQIDAMRATRDWRGERVVVTGVVWRRELVSSGGRRLAQARVTAFGAHSGESVVEQSLKPLIVLSGAYCFFGLAKLSEVSDVQVGEALALECTVLEFRITERGRMPVLELCDFE